MSECYNGMDEFMRTVMRAANDFEAWACRHIAFEELDDVWPYLLEDRFGEACLTVIMPTALAELEAKEFLRIALRLRLPIKLSEDLRVPVDVTAPNPIRDSTFRAFRIQTVRELVEDDLCEAFTLADDPFDDNFSPPHFALYGVDSDGLLEHIADRRTYSEALSLAQKIAPGVQFPSAPIAGQTPPIKFPLP